MSVLPKNYARRALDKQRLGELIDWIGTIGLGADTFRRALHKDLKLHIFFSKKRREGGGNISNCQ